MWKHLKQNTITFAQADNIREARVGTKHTESWETSRLGSWALWGRPIGMPHGHTFSVTGWVTTSIHSLYYTTSQSQMTGWCSPCSRYLVSDAPCTHTYIYTEYSPRYSEASSTQNARCSVPCILIFGSHSVYHTVSKVRTTLLLYCGASYINISDENKTFSLLSGTQNNSNPFAVYTLTLLP